MPAGANLNSSKFKMTENGAKQTNWPDNVGIISMEVYFPSYYVDQNELEDYDGVSKGKYTIGLGQKGMGFCDDLEDVNSMALTVVQNLLESVENVSFHDIGRLEVGTETILDKSKSVKSVLMQLFEDSGNTSIDGIDTTNACFGGTSALFNALNWIESSSWDGRYAIVVAVDSAVYAPGNARCSGGAGAVAMLVGPDAPLVFDRGLRGIHMQNVYDFYKPDMASEYPVVDGKLSIKCYIGALDLCYKRYLEKAKAKQMRYGANKSLDLGFLDYFAFHTPFCKIVQKSLARCHFNDYVRSRDNLSSDDKAKYAAFNDARNVTLEDTFIDDGIMKKVERSSVQSSLQLFNDKTKPSLYLAENVGNMYTASLYGSLASLLVNVDIECLIGKRIGMFSYGSGLAAALFSLTVSPDKLHLPQLQQLISSLSKLKEKLKQRHSIAPLRFNQILERREKTHHTKNYVPSGNVNDLFPGTFYLTSVDNQFRRSYLRTPLLKGKIES